MKRHLAHEPHRCTPPVNAVHIAHGLAVHRCCTLYTRRSARIKPCKRRWRCMIYSRYAVGVYMKAIVHYLQTFMLRVFMLVLMAPVLYQLCGRLVYAATTTQKVPTHAHYTCILIGTSRACRWRMHLARAQLPPAFYKSYGPMGADPNMQAPRITLPSPPPASSRGRIARPRCAP